MSATLTQQYTHLYYEHWKCWDGCFNAEPHDCYAVMACPVTRVTAKRIYFRGADDGAKWRRESEMYINRAAIEQGGDAVGRLLSNGGVYHRMMRVVLHLEPPQRESDSLRRVIKATARTPDKPVAELRREAADLHPDRGGDPDAFRAAYARYARAKAVAP
jgi:hypothetical protein